MVRRMSWLMTALVFAVAGAGSVRAQEGPQGAINPQRDCQTILTCQFKRGGSFRGCVSSYSCRRCEFVPSRCRIAGTRGGVCERLRCTW